MRPEQDIIVSSRLISIRHFTFAFEQTEGKRWESWRKPFFPCAPSRSFSRKCLGIPSIMQETLDALEEFQEFPDSMKKIVGSQHADSGILESRPVIYFQQVKGLYSDHGKRYQHRSADVKCVGSKMKWNHEISNSTVELPFREPLQSLLHSTTWIPHSTKTKTQKWAYGQASK